MVNNEQEAFNYAEETVCVDCSAGAYCDGGNLDGRCKDFIDAYNVGNGIIEKRTEQLNELKNRISLALKDGTLQQGFEIICKKLSQLEKENEQLKKKKYLDFEVGIKYEDDGKGKWQSVSARIEVDGNDYFFPGIAGFGETEEEAKEDLKNKINPLLAQVGKLFIAMDESE